ncbi:MAG: phosphatase PAP2 family protein [Prevotella sp.]
MRNSFSAAILSFLMLFTVQRAYPQTVLPQDSTIGTDKSNPYKFKAVQLAVPTVLIGVGLIGLESDWLKYQNHEVRDELQENIDHRLSVDDFTQYAPMVAVYGLDLMGVKGKHRAVDKTIILGTAYALMGISVNVLKTATRVERPDGSSRNSFPSGHTATAFMGAELLRREYWDVSPWIGIAGYTVAAGTGFFRMYNNRHWLTDVIAGAGIGILSVEAAYWLYPTITKALFPKRYKENVLLSPYMTSCDKGLTIRVTF